MSNYLAIATVTATIQRTLQAVVQADIFGARVTTQRPVNLGSGPQESGVNVFLYQVVSNPALANIDSTPFRSKQGVNKRQAALDLYYLFSVYGNEAELEPQRILGSVIRTLNDKSILTGEMIQETINDPSFSFLQDSDLADQVQQINITPVDFNLDDLSKVWSAFFQTPYVLSVVYKVLVILIEGQEGIPRSLPIQGRSLGAFLPNLNQPIIEQVYNKEGVKIPIVENSRLIIRGRNLNQPNIIIRIGAFNITPLEATETQLEISLDSLSIENLYSGVQNLQVIHNFAQPEKENQSNIYPFVLHPTITHLAVHDLMENADETYSGKILIHTNVMLGKKQRIVLALNEWSMNNPLAYAFDATRRKNDTHEVVIPINSLKAGDYLVRIIIDGTESLLDVDNNPENQTYNWFYQPRITIG